MKWPVPSVTAEREAPVACDVTVTLAPTTAEPVGSVTVPRKPPAACPYANVPQKSTKRLHTTDPEISLFILHSLLGNLKTDAYSGFKARRQASFTTSGAKETCSSFLDFKRETELFSTRLSLGGTTRL